MRDILDQASIVSVWAGLGRVWPYGCRQLVPWEHGGSHDYLPRFDSFLPANDSTDAAKRRTQA